MDEVIVNGKKYVSKDELKALIKQHKRETNKGTTPGFINENPKQRMAGVWALNHLGSVIFHDEAMAAIKNGIIVYEDEETRRNNERLYFRMFCKGNPVFSNDAQDAMYFDDVGMAQKVCEKIGNECPALKDGLSVHKVYKGCHETAEDRLLKALFGE